MENLFNCLEKQTFKDIEIIFLDDGSTDNTLLKIKELSKKSSLKESILIYTQKNIGASESRNELIRLSTAEYIFFLDPDDEIPSTSLEILYKKNNFNIKYLLKINNYGIKDVCILYSEI